MKITEVVNPNSKKLKITGIKYSSDEVDSSIPYPLPQSFSFCMMLCGKPKSGKSTMLINLISKRNRFYNQKFDKIFVFSPSLFSGNLVENPFNDLPEEQKHLDLDELSTVIESIYGSHERCLFIFDDVQGEMSTGSHLKTVLDLVNNRRHYTTGGCSIIITTQVYNQVHLKIRKGVSHIAFWNSKNKKEIKSIHEEYLSFLSDTELQQILKKVWIKTHDFLFLSTYASQDKMIFRNFNQILF
jgi:hypothetical protein